MQNNSSSYPNKNAATRPLSVGLIALLMGLNPGLSTAADRHYDPTQPGCTHLFTDTNCWLEGSIPGTGDNALFDSGAMTPYTVNFSASSSSDNSIVNDTYLSWSLGTHTYDIANSLIVGESSGDTSSLAISNGTVTSADGYVGKDAGSFGEVTITNASWVLSDNFPSLQIGVSGDGILNVNNGGYIQSDYIRLGEYSGSSGTLNVSGGIVGNFGRTHIWVGVEGSGVMDIVAGGSVRANNTYISDSSTLMVGEGSGLSSAHLYVNGIMNIDHGGALGSESAWINENGLVVMNGGSFGYDYIRLWGELIAEGGTVGGYGIVMHGGKATFTKGSQLILDVFGFYLEDNSVLSVDGSAFGGADLQMLGNSKATVTGSTWSGRQFYIGESSGDGQSSLTINHNSTIELAGMSVRQTGKLFVNNSIVTAYGIGNSEPLVDGYMQISNGGIVELFNWMNDAGGARVAIANNGVINLEHGTISATSDLSQTGIMMIDGGKLSGKGIIDADLHNLNGGKVSPDNYPGAISVTGDYYQDSASILEIVKPGGRHSAIDEAYIAVSGTAYLGGTLDVSLTDQGYGRFRPHIGDSFDILYAESIEGSFDSLLLAALEPGLKWDISYLTDAIGSTDVVRLSVAAVPLPPTLWLFCSGLLGLIGIARSRRAA